jgi:hypothetical protein
MSERGEDHGDQSEGEAHTIEFLMIQLFEGLGARIIRVEKLIEHLCYTLLHGPVRLHITTPGGTMPNFQATTDKNWTLPISAVTVAGLIVSLPTGLTLAVTDTSGISGLTSIGLMADGVTPALVINAAGNAPTPNVVATITDADAEGSTTTTLPELTFTFDLAEDQTPAELFVDADEAVGTIPVPTPA